MLLFFKMFAFFPPAGVLLRPLRCAWLKLPLYRWSLVSGMNHGSSSSSPSCRTLKVASPGTARVRQRLPELPVTMTLPLSQKSITVDNFEDNDILEAFQLVESAAERSDNVGIDEIPTLSDLHTVIRYSGAFSIRLHGSRILEALVLIQPCRNARTIRPCLATLIVITSPLLAHEAFWRDSADLALDLARRLKMGYRACVMEVFDACADRVLALRKQNFHITALVPMAGILTAEKKGKLGEANDYSASYLMYRDIGSSFPTYEERPALDELVRFSEDLLTLWEEEDELSLATRSPKFPGLPVERKLRLSGLPVVFRDLRSDEIELYYRHFLSAAESDLGFSIEEMPTRRFFWNIFHSCYNVVIEEQSSRKWVAVMCLNDSLFSRSRSSVICDGSLIVSEEFRRSGFGTDLVNIIVGLARDIGYKGFYSDTLIFDQPALICSYRSGFTFSGILPRAVYAKNYGWSDAVLLYTLLQPKSLL